jgi:hypothetical protein
MNATLERGEVIGLRDPLDRFSHDCLWRAEASVQERQLPDLAQPRPPDLPPGLVKLRLVKNK